MREKHELCQKCFHSSHCQLGTHAYMQPVLDGGCAQFRPANPVLSNADRIRAMSNKELAGIMQCECPPGTECSRSIDYPCVTCWLDWLNAAAEKVEE